MLRDLGKRESQLGRHGKAFGHAWGPVGGAPRPPATGKRYLRARAKHAALGR